MGEAVGKRANRVVAGAFSVCSGRPAPKSLSDASYPITNIAKIPMARTQNIFMVFAVVFGILVILVVYIHNVLLAEASISRLK